MNFNLGKYIEISKARKAEWEKIGELVGVLTKKADQLDVLSLLNGHDLVWLFSNALKAFTDGPRRLVTEESVAMSLVSFGISRAEIPKMPLFKKIASWTDAARKVK